MNHFVHRISVAILFQTSLLGEAAMNASPFPLRQFLWITLLCSVWIHISETFRYLVLLLPKLRDHLSPLGDQIPPMNLGVFLIWGIWDTLLTAVTVYTYWLLSQKFGATLRIAVKAGVYVWLGFFVLFWLGMWNMGLATAAIAGMALPLSLVELVVCGLLAQQLSTRVFRSVS